MIQPLQSDGYTCYELWSVTDECEIWCDEQIKGQNIILKWGIH